MPDVALHDGPVGQAEEALAALLEHVHRHGVEQQVVDAVHAELGQGGFDEALEVLHRLGAIEGRLGLDDGARALPVLQGRPDGRLAVAAVVVVVRVDEIHARV